MAEDARLLDAALDPKDLTASFEHFRHEGHAFERALCIERRQNLVWGLNPNQLASPKVSYGHRLLPRGDETKKRLTIGWPAWCPGRHFLDGVSRDRSRLENTGPLHSGQVTDWFEKVDFFVIEKRSGWPELDDGGLMGRQAARTRRRAT